VDSFGQRIAINVSNILAEEAYFGKNIDPAAGSYYIEQLTEKMLETIWRNFQKILQKA
jgi:methylmalonyl-CoA mutase